MNRNVYMSVCVLGGALLGCAETTVIDCAAHRDVPGCEIADDGGSGEEIASGESGVETGESGGTDTGSTDTGGTDSGGTDSGGTDSESTDSESTDSGTSETGEPQPTPCYRHEDCTQCPTCTADSFCDIMLEDPVLEMPACITPKDVITVDDGNAGTLANALTNLDSESVLLIRISGTYELSNSITIGGGGVVAIVGDGTSTVINCSHADTLEVAGETRAYLLDATVSSSSNHNAVTVDGAHLHVDRSIIHAVDDDGIRAKNNSHVRTYAAMISGKKTAFRLSGGSEAHLHHTTAGAYADNGTPTALSCSNSDVIAVDNSIVAGSGAAHVGNCAFHVTHSVIGKIGDGYAVSNMGNIEFGQFSLDWFTGGSDLGDLHLTEVFINIMSQLGVLMLSLRSETYGPHLDIDGEHFYQNENSSYPGADFYSP